MELYVWIGILVCLSQSAMFSGLNLAFFGLSRLELEAEAVSSSRARRVLELRRDSNFLLTTILWGNVGINVLLTLLADSVLLGVLAFLFSTVLITFFGEILPQAYFSRHSVRMAALLGPLLRAYQILLFPVAKPTALMLDAWLGKETPRFFRERVIREILLKHLQDADSEVDLVEGTRSTSWRSTTWQLWRKASRWTRTASSPCRYATARCASPTSIAIRTIPFSSGWRPPAGSGWSSPTRQPGRRC
ncbi:MAG: DUF21 domain-containing protein [Pseudomonadales bacterium]